MFMATLVAVFEQAWDVAFEMSLIGGIGLLALLGGLRIVRGVSDSMST
jgi:hypothetical protein